MIEHPVPLWLYIPGVAIFAVGLYGLVMSWPGHPPEEPGCQLGDEQSAKLPRQTP
jgi:hypothetical protein